MKTKFGAIVVAGSGKIGGQCVGTCRSGQYMRNKTITRNVGSKSQLSQRTVFSNLSQIWRTLTEDQRQAWINATINYPVKNIFGDVIYPSGSNLFQSINSNLRGIGIPLLYVPPKKLTVESMSISQVLINFSTGNIVLYCTTPVPVNHVCKIYATRPLSRGKKFLGVAFRFLLNNSNHDTPNVGIAEDYKRVFGSVGTGGSFIFVKIETVNIISGQVSPAYIMSNI